MSLLFDLATRLARTPLDAPLRRVAALFDRYRDIADNLNNCEFDSNGEGFLVHQGAPHWRVALDIGANRGDWTALVKRINPACVVHAFEPSHETFAMLEKAVGHLAGVVLHEAGVGSTDGVTRFHDYGPGSVLSGFLSREGSTGEAPLRVIESRQVTLARVFEEHNITHVDFAKVDTEGFEMPVLRGMSDALEARRIGCVQFEYGGTWLDAGESLRNASQFLSARGYRVYRVMPDRVVALRYEAMRDEHFKYANFVAVADEDVTLRRWGVPF